MTTVTKQLADGSVAEFDTDRYSPEVIERYVNDFNTNYKAPSPVPTGDTSAVTQPSLPEVDPSKYDDWGSYLTKQAGGFVQGAGRGLAGLGDMGISGINAASTFLSNPVRQLRGEEPQTAGFMHPLTTLYDENMPAAPEGYDEAAGWGEMIGPILAAEVVSGGLATPEVLATMRGASLLPKIAKIGETALAKPIIKTPVIAGAGIVGGEVGGGVGEMIGGERGKTIGTVVGGALGPGGGPTAAKNVANKVALDANSPAKIARLERQGIEPTIGSVGRPSMGLLQDVTGRKILGGSPAVKARSELYRKLEQAIIDNVATVRGRSSGTPDPATGLVHADTITPEPSTGQISKESIGGELAHTSRKGITRADKLIEDIQEELVRDIGGGTSVDPTPFYDRMDKLLSTVDDAGLRDQLYRIVDDFDRNVPGMPNYAPPRIDPITGQPPPASGKWDQALTKQPTYEAVSGRRSEVGRTLTNEGQGIRKGFTSQGYKGMTEAMEETAKKQGVTDFGPRQAKTKQAYEDIEAMEPSSELASGAGAAFDSLFSGTNKQSIEQLDPFIRNAPEDTARVLANLLDFRLRGEGRAGIDQPSPEHLDMVRLDNAITKGNPDYRVAMTGGVPEVEANLKDIGEIAHTENISKGKRTVPGPRGGTTIGAMALPGLGTASGAITGLMHGGDDILSQIFSTAAGAGLGTIAGEGGTYALGKLMTNPNFVRAIANPNDPAGRTLRRALEGINAEAAYKSSTDKSDLEQQWEEEQVRSFMNR